MAYVKLYKFIGDSRLGYQTVNQLAANVDEMRTAMYVQHGGEEPAAQDAFDRLGHHNITEIPRGVANLITYSTGLLAIDAKFTWTQPAMPSVWRVGIGEYVVRVVGLSEFWGKVSCFGSSGTTYLEPQCRSFYPVATNGFNAGLHIWTYVLSGGDFVANDVPFSIALHGIP